MKIPGIISNKLIFFGKYIKNKIAFTEKFNKNPRNKFTYPDYSWGVFGLFLEFKHYMCRHDESVTPPHDESRQVQDGAHVTW